MQRSYDIRRFAGGAKGVAMSSVNFDSTGLAQFFQSVSGQSQSQTPTVSDGSDDSQSTAQVQPHHHHHHGGNSAQFQQIQQAVTQALQQAQSDPTADPNQVVEDAIQKAIANPTASDPSSASDPTTSTTAAGSPEAFAQTLQSLGVTPQQFHEDFLAAVKNAQNGNVDPAAAFQSFPPGVGVDTTA
jgi:cytoskeletal protein RodZ